MKYILTVLLFLISVFAKSQITSGRYGFGLDIAYNPSNRLLTGFFESSTGYDESTGESRFFCIFYIKGVKKDSLFDVETFYPLNKEKDNIIGKIKFKDSITISINLPREHGGCWNVWHFADGFSDFELEKKINCIEIRYIEADKSYFYNDRDDKMKKNSYLVKGDIIYIDKIVDLWVHCRFFGKSITEGRIKKETINK